MIKATWGVGVQLAHRSRLLSMVARTLRRQGIKSPGHITTTANSNDCVLPSAQPAFSAKTMHISVCVWYGCWCVCVCMVVCENMENYRELFLSTLWVLEIERRSSGLVTRVFTC